MYTIDRGINQERVQKMNRTLIINLLRKEGVCARARLAKLSNLEQATVTNIINDFLEWGLVQEIGFISGDKGRRSIGISINNEGFGVLGIQLARKNYKIGIFNFSGKQVSMREEELDRTLSPREVFEKVIQEAKEMIKMAVDRKIIAIGVAVPGPYNIKRGRIELMTESVGWEHISIKEELGKKFHLPVFVENDANSGALVHHWYSGKCPSDNSDEVLVYIADGQGVGAGIIYNGELLKGHIGVMGEIGHATINFKGPRCACGNYGCLEAYCSSIAFTREINRVLGKGEKYTFSDAVRMVREGNPIVKEIFLTSCDNLAIGIVNVINSFSPSLIVIGDEMSHVIPDEMLRRVKDEVKRRVLPKIYDHVEIIMSSVQDSMIHGAAIAAIKDVFHNLSQYFENNTSYNIKT